MRRRTTLLAVLLLSGGPVTGAQQEGTAVCRDAFVELVAAGEVRSIDGLAIEPDWGGYWRTSWVPGREGDRARLERADCVDGEWQEPVPAFPGAGFSDYHPSVSPDGSRLYFTSTRPAEGDGPAVRQNGWFAPLPIGSGRPRPLPGAFSRTWDGHPIELGDGSLLFASDRPGGAGMVDFYRLEGVDDALAVPVPELNSSSTDNDAAYERASGLLVFARYREVSGDIGLWISRRTEEGWAPPSVLPTVNTREWEASPAFTPEGDLLLFRRGDGPFVAIAVDEITSTLRPR